MFKMTEEEKKILEAIERTYRPGTPQSWALRRIIDESGKVCEWKYYCDEDDSDESCFISQCSPHTPQGKMGDYCPICGKPIREVKT